MYPIAFFQQLHPQTSSQCQFSITPNFSLTTFLYVRVQKITWGKYHIFRTKGGGWLGGPVVRGQGCSLFQLVSLSCTWWQLVALSQTWLYLVTLGCTCLHLGLLSCSWLHLVALHCTFLPLVILSSTWLYLFTLVYTWLYLVTLGCI